MVQLAFFCPTLNTDMSVGHYFNEKRLLTSPWALTIFFSIPQMLHDLSPLPVDWKNVFISFICLSLFEANQMLHLLETYLDVFGQGESLLFLGPEYL